jgi:hypothetical protein
VINGEWRYEHLISTIPWPAWNKFCNLPSDVKEEIDNLKNASIDIDYNPKTLENDAHWIYEPNEAIAHHRLLLRSNFAKGSRGYWTETNSVRSLPLGDGVRFHNEYAYPINTVNKPLAVEKILSWAKTKSIIGLGRWGTWEHMNSDVAVDQALKLAQELSSENS